MGISVKRRVFVFLFPLFVNRTGDILLHVFRNVHCMHIQGNLQVVLKTEFACVMIASFVEKLPFGRGERLRACW